MQPGLALEIISGTDRPLVEVGMGVATPRHREGRARRGSSVRVTSLQMRTMIIGLGSVGDDGSLPPFALWIRKAI